MQPNRVQTRAERAWDAWIEFLQHFGTCEVNPRMGVTVADAHGQAALVRLSSSELADYVDQGWDRSMIPAWGLGRDLPLPLTDSFNEGFGSQPTAWAVYELDGLDLVRVESD